MARAWMAEGRSKPWTPPISMRHIVGGRNFADEATRSRKTYVGVDTTEKLRLQFHVVERLANLGPVGLDGRCSKAGQQRVAEG